MNILFVCAVLPYPLHSGGQTRTFQLLRRLSRRHRITLVSFIRHEDERQYGKALNFCQAVHMVLRGRAWQPKYYIRALLGKYPFLLATYDNILMHDELERLISREHFDIVHAEPFYVWPSIPNLTIPLVISEHNVEYAVYDSYVRHFPLPILRPALSWDVFKLRKWERFSWRRARAVTAVSDSDAREIEAYVRYGVTVVPNGVDLREFRYQKPVKRENPIVLFVGNFRWHPNQDAADTLVNQIWPKLKVRMPKAELIIAGRDVPLDVQRRTRHIGGTIRENVEDIAQVYRSADFLVAPHKTAGGTKFKMLEAMASGLAIITTKQGIAGLHAEAGVHYAQAASPDDFITNIVHLWDNRSLRETLIRHARALVEINYSWDHIADILDGVWRKAYAKR